MRKIILTFGILFVFSVNIFAIGSGIGIRSIGMGGTGIATANDITAAYYNPAGLMFGPEYFEGKLFYGYSAIGLQSVLDAASSGDTFISDYFDKDLTAFANVNAGFGVSVKKIGVSGYASGQFMFDKPADALSFIYGGSLLTEMPITLGSKISTPLLTDVAFGINIKPITKHSIMTFVDSGNGIQEISVGSGFGFDVGAQVKITPLISGGFVIRNLASSLNSKVTSTIITVDGSGNVTPGTETESEEKSSIPAEVGIGASVIIPITGTILAADVNSYSAEDKDKTYTDLNLGVEQKFIVNLIALRMGYFSDTEMDDRYFTWGLGFNFTGFNFGFSASNSYVDSSRSLAVYEIGTAF